MVQPPLAAGSSARILHVIATLDDPVTTNEIAERLDISQSSAGTTTMRMWRSGLVERHRRDDTRGQPYEYTLATDHPGGEHP